MSRGARQAGGREDRPLIEIRLEAVHLVLAGAVLLFLVGGWWLLRSSPAPESPPETPVTQRVFSGGEVADSEDVAEDLTFFDRLGGQAGGAGRAGVERLPQRTSPPDREREVPEASYAIQVFAGEREAAESLRRKLESRGYTVRVVGSAGGIARVRVGDHAGRPEAENEARRLADEEGLTTWIVRAR